MIDNHILKKYLNIELDNIISFDSLGLINSKVSNVLTFLDDPKYINQLNSNLNISGVFITNELSTFIDNKNVIKIYTEDPRYSFYSLYNSIALENHVIFQSIIHNSSKIHKTAQVSANNVIIGQNTIVESNVIIKSGVEIGDNCRVCAGAVLGCDGFELQRTKFGVISVEHDGKLIIGNEVFIGSNSTLYKGFFKRDTIIGTETKIDNLVYIAHGVQIGSNCLLIGHCMVSGSTTIGHNVWVGPRAVVSNGLFIGDNVKISIGSVVTKNISDGNHVTGNFAIDHNKFIKHIKNLI